MSLGAAATMLKNEHISKDEQPTLTLKDINRALERLEAEYGMRSTDFAAIRSTDGELTVREDDIAEWEYMMQAKAEIESYLLESYLKLIDDSDYTSQENRHTHALAA